MGWVGGWEREEREGRERGRFFLTKVKKGESKKLSRKSF
jgi:hypothetical protein